jgi:hypothetical protein
MKLATFLLLTAALSAAELKLGKPLTLKETTPIPALLANPDAHLGKVVQVKGKITEVCQNMGCWMVIVDEPSGKNVRIKVKDGEIEFTKIEMSKEQAIAYRKHEAEENKKPFDPASVTGGMTLYQLAGQGAVIVD